MADAQNRKVYKIDKDKTYQVIDNFSASDAWRCDFIGKYWPEEKKERIADLLFKREFDEKGNPVGMALTNWRVNIGAGSYENRETKGVDMKEALVCFSQYLSDNTLNSEQEDFLKSIITYVCANGDITKDIVVNSAPFDERLLVFQPYMIPLGKYIDNIHSVINPQEYA
jgi:hypothetical protein